MRRSVKLSTRAAGMLAGVTVAASTWAAYMVTRKGVRTMSDSAFYFTPFEMDVPFETVSFHSAEGLRLTGWWLDRPTARQAVILCPGYGRSKSDMLGVGTRLWKAGFNVLMFDFRDQGESERAIPTIGHYEREDLGAALDYVLWRVPGAEVGVMGFSMGAATCILAAAERPEIRAVVADGSFADLRAILRNFFKKLTRLPASPSMQLAEMMIRARAGYRISSVKPVDQIGKIAPRPVLIIHGTNDGVTPVGDAYALYEAAGEPKELWITPNTGHCGTYFLDREAYTRRLIGFFEKALVEVESGVGSRESGTGNIES